MHYDFEPMKAFNLLDVDRSGEISPVEIVNFLRKNHVSVDMQDAEDLIFDYDANSDNHIGLNEFC